jgi:hypothetical protein
MKHPYPLKIIIKFYTKQVSVVILSELKPRQKMYINNTL